MALDNIVPVRISRRPRFYPPTEGIYVDSVFHSGFSNRNVNIHTAENGWKDNIHFMAGDSFTTPLEFAQVFSESIAIQQRFINTHSRQLHTAQK